MGFDYAPPKYAQVVAEIKRRIESGQYAPGSLLPSEHQLVESFGVSRPTIVKSLSALRQDGWIETQQGKGSFVRGRPALAGAERTRPAQNILELDQGARAFLRQRLLADDGEPVELASVWLPLELAKGTDLASPDLLGESVRHHLQARKKVRLDHAVERISARKPTGEEAGLLGVAADAPVLNVVVTAYDALAQPVHVTDIVLPGDRHEIHDAYPFI
jgi:DNA-binding GntR family transcriptional regulator